MTRYEKNIALRHITGTVTGLRGAYTCQDIILAKSSAIAAFRARAPVLQLSCRAAADNERNGLFASTVPVEGCCNKSTLSRHTPWVPRKCVHSAAMASWYLTLTIVQQSAEARVVR